MHDQLTPQPAPTGDVLTIRPLHGRIGLALTGEADFTVRETLRAALAELPVDGTSDIHLDLAGLRFIDVSCTRELIAITDRHPAARLIVHNPPDSLVLITVLAFPKARIGLTGPPAVRRPGPGPRGLLRGSGIGIVHIPVVARVMRAAALNTSKEPRPRCWLAEPICAGVAPALSQRPSGVRPGRLAHEPPRPRGNDDLKRDRRGPGGPRRRRPGAAC